jgi:hypothetical protein
MQKIFLRNLTYFRHMMYIESDAFKGTFKCAVFQDFILKLGGIGQFVKPRCAVAVFAAAFIAKKMDTARRVPKQNHPNRMRFVLRGE